MIDFVGCNTMEDRMRYIEERELEAMEEICAGLGDGGSLINKCEIWGVQYGRIMDWVNRSVTRRERYQRALAARDEWAKEVFLKELRALALSDVKDLYDSAGKFKSVGELPSWSSKVIKSIDTYMSSGGKVVSIKMWDKLKAIELLGKNLSLFTDKVEVSHETKLEDILAEVSEFGVEEEGRVH